MSTLDTIAVAILLFGSIVLYLSTCASCIKFCRQSLRDHDITEAIVFVAILLLLIGVGILVLSVVI